MNLKTSSEVFRGQLIKSSLIWPNARSLVKKGIMKKAPVLKTGVTSCHQTIQSIARLRKTMLKIVINVKAALLSSVTAPAVVVFALCEQNKHDIAKSRTDNAFCLTEHAPTPTTRWHHGRELV